MNFFETATVIAGNVSIVYDIYIYKAEGFVLVFCFFVQ